MFRFKNVAYQKDGVSDGTTINSQSATSNVATAAGKDNDATKQLQELQAAFEKERAQREADVAKVKSAYQKQLNEQQAQMNQLQQDYQKQLDELKLNTLDDEGKKRYAKEIEHRQLSQKEQEADFLRQQLAEMQNMTNYLDAFISLGVDRSQLVTDQGVTALVQSGWNAVAKTMKELRDKANGSTTPPATSTAATGSKEIPAPDVVTPDGGAVGKMSLAELADKYSGGDVDSLFKLVETGQLSPDILPVEE